MNTCSTAKKKSLPSLTSSLSLIQRLLPLHRRINRMHWTTNYVLSDFTPFPCKELTRKGIITLKVYGFNKMVVPAADEEEIIVFHMTSLEAALDLRGSEVSSSPYRHGDGSNRVCVRAFNVPAVQFYFQAQFNSILAIFCCEAPFKSVTINFENTSTFHAPNLMFL